MAEGLFGEVASQLTSRIFGSILWFGIAAVAIGIVSFLMWFFLIYRKKFDIEVRIKSNRAEDKYSCIVDKSAILKDRKTKTPFYRVWGLRRDFPTPKYDVLQSSNKGDFIEMYREGEDEFYFLLPPKIDKKRILKADGRFYAIGDQSQTLFDPEMAFWNIKRKQHNKGMFSVEQWYMKLLPYFPHIIGGVILIFILYILMDHLPGILSQLERLVAAMNEMQRGQVVSA